jgi:hypothetical protein
MFMSCGSSELIIAEFPVKKKKKKPRLDKVRLLKRQGLIAIAKAKSRT